MNFNYFQNLFMVFQNKPDSLSTVIEDTMMKLLFLSSITYLLPTLTILTIGDFFSHFCNNGI